MPFNEIEAAIARGALDEAEALLAGPDGHDIPTESLKRFQLDIARRRVAAARDRRFAQEAYAAGDFTEAASRAASAREAEDTPDLKILYDQANLAMQRTPLMLLLIGAITASPPDWQAAAEAARRVSILQSLPPDPPSDGTAQIDRHTHALVQLAVNGAKLDVLCDQRREIEDEAWNDQKHIFQTTMQDGLDALVEHPSIDVFHQHAQTLFDRAALLDTAIKLPPDLSDTNAQTLVLTQIERFVTTLSASPLEPLDRKDVATQVGCLAAMDKLYSLLQHDWERAVRSASDQKEAKAKRRADFAQALSAHTNPMRRLLKVRDSYLAATAQRSLDRSDNIEHVLATILQTPDRALVALSRGDMRLEDSHRLYHHLGLDDDQTSPRLSHFWLIIASLTGVVLVALCARWLLPSSLSTGTTTAIATQIAFDVTTQITQTTLEVTSSPVLPPTLRPTAQATRRPTATSTPTLAPTFTPVAPTATPRPRPTATPRPKPTATPRPKPLVFMSIQRTSETGNDKANCIGIKLVFKDAPVSVAGWKIQTDSGASSTINSGGFGNVCVANSYQDFHFSIIPTNSLVSVGNSAPARGGNTFEVYLQF